MKKKISEILPENFQFLMVCLTVDPGVGMRGEGVFPSLNASTATYISYGD